MKKLFFIIFVFISVSVLGQEQNPNALEIHFTNGQTQSITLDSIDYINFIKTNIDDDEPDGDNNSKGVVGELTINGTKTPFYYIQGDNDPDLHKFDYDALLWRKDAELLSIQIYEDIMTFKKGEDLSDRVTVVPTFISGFLGGHILESGNITLTDMDSKYITLTFNNAVVKEIRGYHGPITIDGTIKLPIDGEMGSLKNIEGYEWIM